jgi:ABC-type amino acid transport substrate-binding protein
MALLIGLWNIAGTRAHAALDRPDTNSGVRIKVTAAEEQWIQTHPQVRWGFDPDWPPFSSFDSYHRLTGIDADLTRLVARRTGLQLSMVSGASWADVYAKAIAGDVDFLSATAKTDERQAAFDYTTAYAAFPVVVVTRNEAPFLTTMPDLRSLTIAAARDHVITEQLKRDFPTSRLILTDNPEQALKLVAHGSADATVQNLAVACRAIRLNGLTNLKLSGITHYEFPLRFAVRKDAPELTSILNKGLATITADEQETIFAAHLTPDIGKARDWSAWRRRAPRGRRRTPTPARPGSSRRP